MQVLTCPDESLDPSSCLVFLAGGITGCRDWQTEMAKRFEKESDKLTLINPRRENFDITDPTMSADQIDWEARHLRFADATLFWFPFETLCPITLFELGKQAALRKRIFVGCHPAYARKFDVEHQLKDLRPDVTVHDNFEDLVEDVLKFTRHFSV